MALKSSDACDGLDFLVTGAGAGGASVIVTSSSVGVDLDFFFAFLTGAGAGDEESGPTGADLGVLVFFVDTGMLAGTGDASFSSTSSLLFLLFLLEISLSLSLSLDEETALPLAQSQIFSARDYCTLSSRLPLPWFARLQRAV
jgi:hypothetical protein